MSRTMSMKGFFAAVMLSLCVTAGGGATDARAAAEESGSLHVFPATWTTDEGKPAKLSDWKGRKAVIAMFYGSCHGSCPMIIQKLRKVETLFEEKGVKTDFILVSFDPSKDTPKSLRAYRERIGLTSPSWTMLSGKSEDVRRLSMLLGVKYRKDPESGEIMHDNKISLLSEDGKILKTLQNLTDSENELLP